MKNSGNAYKRIISNIGLFVSELKGFLLDQYESSVTHTFVDRVGIRKKTLPFRRKALSSIEKIRAVTLYSRIVSSMLAVSSRVYGTFLLTFGLYIMLVYLVKRFALTVDFGSFSDVLLSCCMMLSALPIFFVDRSMSSLIRSSRFTNYIITKIIGIRPAKLKANEKNGSGYITALILGLLCGSLTIFYSPFKILLVIAIILAVMIVFASPESGVTLLLLLLPFLNNTSLVCAVSVVLASLAWKTFTLKRTLHFKSIDYAVLLFSALVLVFGILSLRWPDGIVSSLKLLAFIMSFFAVTQLVTNSDMFYCCIRSMLVGNLLASVITLIQFLPSVEAVPYTQYIVINFTPEYSVVMMIVISLPLLLGRLYYTSSKTVATIAFLISVAAIALSKPDSYWFVAVAVFFVTLYAVSKRGFLIVLFLSLTGVAATNYFIADSLRASALETLTVVFAPLKELFENAFNTTHLFEGVGFGEVSYRFVNTTADKLATLPKSTFSYVLASGGVMTALTYMFVLFGTAVNSINAMVYGNDKKLKIMIKVLSCSIFGLLLESVYENIFSGGAMTLMFWLLLGLICTGNNILENQVSRDVYIV